MSRILLAGWKRERFHNPFYARNGQVKAEISYTIPEN